MHLEQTVFVLQWNESLNLEPRCLSRLI